MARYAAVGHGTYRYLLYLDRTHETTYPGATEPWILSWLKGLPPRQTNPVRVTYRIERSFFQPSFGITYSHAYWAQQLDLAPGATAGVIDASRSTASAHTARLQTTYGADQLGPYRLEGADVTPPSAVSNFVELKLSGLGHALLDTRQMGWSSAAPEEITGTSDTPLELVLSGNYAGKFSVTGATSYTVTPGSVTIQLASGQFDVKVTPVSAGA